MKLKKFNCLVKVYYSTGYISWHGLVIEARHEAEAEEDVVDLLQSWDNTDSYALEEISPTKQFRVLPFLINARIQYKTHQKSVKFKIKAPDEKTARETANEVVSSWKGVVNFQIDNVYETDRKHV